MNPALPLPTIAEAQEADIEQALYRHLIAMAEVEQLVLQTETGPAISPINAAQTEALPRITYQLIGDEPAVNLKCEDGAKVATFHLKCWANDPRAAKGLAKAIRGRRADPRLAGFIGLMGGLIQVAYVRIPDAAAELEQPMQGGDVDEYWHLLVVVIQYYDPISQPD